MSNRQQEHLRRRLYHDVRRAILAHAGEKARSRSFDPVFYIADHADSLAYDIAYMLRRDWSITLRARPQRKMRGEVTT